MKRPRTYVLMLALVIVLEAGVSAPLLQAQLPQGDGTSSSRSAVSESRADAATVTLDEARAVVAGAELCDVSRPFHTLSWLAAAAPSLSPLSAAFRSLL